MKCSIDRVRFKYSVAFLIIDFGPDDVLKQNDVRSTEERMMARASSIEKECEKNECKYNN
jgi:hypothetical protein